MKMSLGLSSHVGRVGTRQNRKQSVGLARDAPGRRGNPTVEEMRALSF